MPDSQPAHDAQEHGEAVECRTLNWWEGGGLAGTGNDVTARTGSPDVEMSRSADVDNLAFVTQSGFASHHLNRFLPSRILLNECSKNAFSIGFSPGRSRNELKFEYFWIRASHTGSPSSLSGSEAFQWLFLVWRRG